MFTSIGETKDWPGWLGFDGDKNPDSKVHGANMEPIWGWQDPGGPHVGPMNLAIWEGFRQILWCELYRPLPGQWIW